MKKKLLLTLLTVFILISSCDTPIDGTNSEDEINIDDDTPSSNEEDEDEDSGNNVTVRTMEAYDGNGNRLGYCTLASAGSLTIYSDAGYFYAIDWAGTIHNGFAYSTGLDGSGTIFTVGTADYAYHGKTVLKINDQLYTYADISNGLAISNSSITEYMSWIYYNTITNYDSPQQLNEMYVTYILEPITRAQAGIPTTITAPITISYE